MGSSVLHRAQTKATSIRLGEVLLGYSIDRPTEGIVSNRAVNANLAIAALRSLTLTLISVSALTFPISASVSAPR